jgi:hypothetical protein
MSEMVEREGIRESTEGTSTEGGVSVGAVVTTEEVVDEILRPLREQLLSMARYGDAMRASRDHLETENERLRQALEGNP